MASEQIRYKLAAQKAPAFIDEFLVECPKCRGCARLIPMGDLSDCGHVENGLMMALEPKYFECTKCNFSRTWNPKKPSFFRSLVNWFGELSLYMQVDCGDHRIWAINAAHLEFLEEELRGCVAGGVEASPPLLEWLEYRDYDQIAACLTNLREEKESALVVVNTVT